MKAYEKHENNYFGGVLSGQIDNTQPETKGVFRTLSNV